MMRGQWDRTQIGWLIAVALLPAAVATVIEAGSFALAGMAVAFSAAAAWQMVFRHLAGTPFSPSGAVIAVSLVALGPSGAALWQIALAASFGIVLAELIFGGWGRNVIAAPVAALAFLDLSFPGLTPTEPGPLIALASALSGGLLAATGVINLRGPLAFLVTSQFLLALSGAPPGLSGAMIFGLFFLVADPVATAATPIGRWIHGALAGALWVLFSLGGAGTDMPGPIVSAALLAAIFAPLIDHAAIALSARRRTRSNV